MPIASLPSGADLDDALVPAVGLLDRLVDWQCIDELVGDDDDGPARNVGERGVPQRSARRNLRSRRRCTSRIFGLISTRCSDDGGAEVLDDLHRAHGVGHQCAASGPELDDAHVFRRAHLFPDGGHPQADNLAEHLADFRAR